jgi:F-type H+-transporting ATPase subunit gamma
LKELIVNGVKSKKYSKIYLAYTRFVSMAVQVPVLELFLPFKIEEIRDEAEFKAHKVFKFDQNATAIVNTVLNEYLEATISGVLVSAATSEYAARMVTMHQATENSKTIAEELTTKFNKARQSAITAQIQEITNARLKV